MRWYDWFKFEGYFHIMKTDPPSQNPIYRIKALDRALDLLDCFSFQNREMTLSELAEHTGLNKTTAKRMLSNLTGRGYLRQDPNTKRYRLGLRLFELGGIVYSSFSLRKAAAPHMTNLMEKTGLTVLLGVSREDHLVYVDKREGTGIIRISSDIGWRRPLHFGMLGMILMAYLHQDKLESILDKYPLEAYTPLSITDRDAFSLRLANIRKDGYVIERGEAHDGITGVAAPVRDYSRKVIAAVGVARPSGQEHEKDKLDRLIELVRKMADAISSDLGYLKI